MWCYQHTQEGWPWPPSINFCFWNSYPHSWKSSTTGLGAVWASGRWNKMSFKVSSNPNHSMLILGGSRGGAHPSELQSPAGRGRLHPHIAAIGLSLQARAANASPALGAQPPPSQRQGQALMSLMFYCLLGVTAEHGPAGRAGLGHRGLSAEPGSAPCAPCPSRTPRGRGWDPPGSGEHRGRAGGAGAAKQRWLGVTGGDSGCQWGTHCGVGQAGSAGQPWLRAGLSPGAHWEWISAPAPCPKPKPLGPKFLA